MASTRSWAHSIPADLREQLRVLHRQQPWRHVKILELLAIWAGAAAMAMRFDTLWVRLPCWIVIGLCLHGLGVFMHEGAHHALFRKPLADRLVGFFCGLPVGISCSNYRATHMLHHRYENTDRDPDNLEATIPHRGLRSIVYYSWFLIGMPVYALWLVLTGPFRADSRRERAICVLETVALAGLLAAAILASRRLGFAEELVAGWAAALPFAILVANVRGLAEHTLLDHGDPPDPLQSTRSLPSNRLISYFFNNQNYHLEHHLFPQVPWHNLPAVHRLLQPIYEREQAAVCRSYLRYLSIAFRFGDGNRNPG